MEELTIHQGPSVDAVEERIDGQVEMELSSMASDKSSDDTSPLLLGKFKDVDALEKAYISLQSDYTKKCQLLSEKEKASAPDSVTEENVDARSNKVDVSSLSKEDKDNILQEYIFSSPDLKDKFLAKYFDELNIPSSPKLISSDRGSGYVLTPKNKPKTLEEAGKLVENILKDNN